MREVATFVENKIRSFLLTSDQGCTTGTQPVNPGTISLKQALLDAIRKAAGYVSGTRSTAFARWSSSTVEVAGQLRCS
jgi:hypothetical protein